jgi:hypothetical protein
MPDGNEFSPQDIQDLQAIAAKLPAGHPALAKINGALASYGMTEKGAAATPPIAKSGLSINTSLSPMEMVGAGVGDEARGNQQMAQRYINAGPKEVMGGAKDIGQGNISRGAHRIITGTGVSALPAMASVLPMAMAEAPLATGLSLGGGMLGQYGGRKAAEAVGASPDQADLAGDVGGLGGSILGGYGAARTIPRLRGLFKTDPLEAAKTALRPRSEAQFGGEEEGGIGPGDFNRARPHLQGVQSLAELRKALPGAKASVWKPYADAISKFGDEEVQVGNETHTLADLETERLDNTAKLSVLKSKYPTAQRAALRVDPELRALNERQNSVIDAIDQKLYDKANIDAREIRRTHGALQGIEKLAERAKTAPDRPFGLGRLQNVSLTKPLSNVPTALQSGRDVLAGRPLFSGSPTDVAVSEAFRAPQTGLAQRSGLSGLRQLTNVPTPYLPDQLEKVRTLLLGP